MTNPIIMQMQINLQKSKKDYQEYSIKAQRLLNEIITIIASPYFDTPDELRAEEIEQAGDELLTVKHKLIDLQKQINKYKRDLGND